MVRRNVVDERQDMQSLGRKRKVESKRRQEIREWLIAHVWIVGKNASRPRADLAHYHLIVCRVLEVVSA